jgi:bacterial/archaeal transporter family protein
MDVDQRYLNQKFAFRGRIGRRLRMRTIMGDTSHTLGNSEDGKNMNWFIWALLSACFAGLTAILAKIGVEHVDSNLATAIRTVVILVFAWSVALFTKSQPISTIGRRTWIFLILSGIATGLSWLCYFRALQLGEASRVAPVDKLSVVIAIALAAIFLHERLTWHHWVGGLLIFSGATVLAYA